MSDIDTVVVDSLKALDPEWPIREEKRTSLDASNVATSRLCTAAQRHYRTCGAKMNGGEGLFDTGQRDTFHYRVEGLLLRSAEVR